MQSWFNPVPLGNPPQGRRVVEGKEMSHVPRGVPTVEPFGDEPDDVDESAFVEVPPPRHKTSSVPEYSKSIYFKRGKKLRYKKDKCPKGSEGIVLEVREHTAKGISFYQKSGVFSQDYFEPVS